MAIRNQTSSIEPDAAAPQTPRPPDRFMRLLGERAGMALWSVDPVSGRIDLYSDLSPILGVQPSDMAGLMHLVHADDVDITRSRFEGTMEHGGAGQFEVRLRAADGAWVHFLVCYFSDPHPSGRFTLHGVSREIGGLVGARAAANETIRQSHLIETLAGIGYWRYEMDSEHFTWSDEMYAIHGLDRNDGPPPLLSMPDYCHPEDRQRLLEYRETYSGRDAPPMAIRIVRPDGEIRHLMVRNAIDRDASGAPVARYGILQDVTETKRAEAAARESDLRYRFIAEHASDMIVRVAPDGTLRFASPGSRRVFGYEPEEMMAMCPEAMTHPDDAEMVCAHVARLMQGVGPSEESLRYRARHKDGSWIWIESKPSVIFDDLTGEPLESIDIIRNITDAKAAEAELEDARRRAEAAAAAKSVFLANMSHELRTPLTSITGFSRLMEERTDLPDEARHFTRRIRDASDALLSIINDVLDFSKLEAGQVALERQPLCLRRLVDDALGLLAVQAAAKGVALAIEIDPATPPQLVGDAGRLRQILLNLLSNALKFTDAGSVTVRATYAQDIGRLRLAVADTGSGIAPEAVTRLFERFSQADVSINRTHGGTGLGLAISKGIVELMGGQIGVETAPGLGSTFWFEVPAEPADVAAAPEAKAGESLDLPPLRLLVVDDTAVNRELVRLMLEPLGLEIEEAAGGAEGVQAAMRSAFDLILMDVRMPGVDGLEATRVIRGAGTVNHATPILALTADVQPENAEACRAAGMNDVVAKPITPAVLIAKILQWGDKAEDPARVAVA